MTRLSSGIYELSPSLSMSSMTFIRDTKGLFISHSETLDSLKHGITNVQWAAKVMTPASMYFLWKQGS